ncbi:MAG: hypothetical protein J5666_07765 [Bacilli bacterium]|nr:hypothetical protein [Bacilli bacterium]
MDYKTFMHNFDVKKKELVDFINLRSKRNSERAEEMVSDYLNQMAGGDYSIKSYKAKIIHNELDCNHAIRDVVEVKDKVIANINELIDDYFKEYLDSLVDENLPKQKVKDMRDFVTENRKQKHEVLLKKNNIEKDFKEKTKELESEKKDKLNSYNEKINSLKMRLVSDLKKLSEKTIKDYSDFELALLDENDKKKIKELKDKIKEIRSKSLDEEYNIKMASYEEILQEELNFTKSYQEFIYELEKYRMEMLVKLAELERDNSLLTIDNDYQDVLYDVKQDKKVNERFKKEIDKLEELINEHNSFISVNYQEHEYSISEKMFIYDLASLYIYNMLVNIHASNRFDPLGNFLIYLNNLIGKEKELYTKMLEDLVPLCEKEKEELVKSLDGFTGNPKKKLTKEDLINNVLESLDRYYDNYRKEIDFYNMIYSDLLFDIVKNIEKGYLEKVGASFDTSFIDNVSNYDYIDLEKYGYKKERTLETITNEEGETISYLDIIDGKKKELFDKLNSEYQQKAEVIKARLDALNDDRKNKDSAVNEECAKRVEEYNKEYKEIIEKNKKELLQKEKEVVKATSKSKEKARKLLLESKKAL